MTNQKMKTYFVNFFFIQNPLSFVISFVYDLTFVTMEVQQIGPLGSHLGYMLHHPFFARLFTLCWVIIKLITLCVFIFNFINYLWDWVQSDLIFSSFFSFFFFFWGNGPL
jgi:hypothetical protein